MKSKFNVTTDFFVGAELFVNEGFSWKWSDGEPIDTKNWLNSDGCNEEPYMPIRKGFK